MNAKIEPWIEERLQAWSTNFDCCAECPEISAAKGFRLPGQRAIINVLNKLVGLIFPGYLSRGDGSAYAGYEPDSADAGSTAQALYDCILPVLKYYCEKVECRKCGDCERLAQSVVSSFFDSGAEIGPMLRRDVRAAYEGDPAAKSEIEIIMSYPGLYAITVHRIAHLLAALKVPLVPRVMSEYAHSRTGIDIHPGASIGPGFFIDHGTGVVIGETCTIGANVKIYQGVTLGALSFAKDENGNLVKGIKRHPDVEDDVIIYAGATILGGNTVIGRGSVIGGNVWLVHSVPPYTRVYNAQPSPLIKHKDESHT